MNDQQPKPGRINIKDIKVGTWESKNTRCPPPSKLKSQAIWKAIRTEEGGVGSEIWERNHDRL